MCGIAGICLPHQEPIDRALLARMTGSLIHRGPDAGGVHLVPGCGLGHRRLSIIDIEGGAQPMVHPHLGIAIVFNGEIYNYRELIRELEAKGHQFCTQSDTEALLHGYVEWGDEVVHKLLGMFAFGIWDPTKRRLFMARDRMGQKPLYWAPLPQGGLAFASELKALALHPKINGDVNLIALGRYLVQECVPSPHSILKGVFKLEPGGSLVYSPDGDDHGPQLNRYWRIPFEAPTPRADHRELTTTFRAMLLQAVRSQLVSDVPLGLFLSGGLDSSAVAVCMAESMSPKNIQSFCVGFKDKSFDESSHARKVADHLGLCHHESVLDAHQVRDLLANITPTLDEPLADASIVPTYLLSQFARKQVTVALGGDGGDELLAGYPTYWADRMANGLALLPRPLVRGCRALADCVPVRTTNFSLSFVVRSFFRGATCPAPTRHAIWLSSFTPNEARDLMTPGTRPSIEDDPLSDVIEHHQSGHYQSRLQAISDFYARFYLADGVLVKVDRASMATSLEVRAPFLDHQLIRFMGALPDQLKLKGRQTKVVLRQAFKDDLPKSILDRKKKGFGIPMAQLLKDDLKGLMLTLLDPTRIRKEGYFQPRQVSQIIDNHLAGRADNRKPLWTLMVFQMWLEELKKNRWQPGGSLGEI